MFKVGDRVRLKYRPWTVHTVVRVYDVTSTDGVVRTIVEFPKHPRDYWGPTAFAGGVELVK